MFFLARPSPPRPAYLCLRGLGRELQHVVVAGTAGAQLLPPAAGGVDHLLAPGSDQATAQRQESGVQRSRGAALPPPHPCPGPKETVAMVLPRPAPCVTQAAPPRHPHLTWEPGGGQTCCAPSLFPLPTPGVGQARPRGHGLYSPGAVVRVGRCRREGGRAWQHTWRRARWRQGRIS